MRNRFLRGGIRRVCLMFAATLMLVSCGPSAPSGAPGSIAPSGGASAGPSPAPRTSPAASGPGVSVSSFAFTPKELQVAAGTTVTWTNTGGQHTVTADGGQFNSDALASGATFTFAFPQAGQFPYYCRFHGGAGGTGMSGVITVT
jgi:plastocyanin